MKHSLFLLSSYLLGPFLLSLTKDSFSHGFLPYLNLGGKLGLWGYLLFGNIFCKSLVKFMESFNATGLWDFMSPFKGSVNPSVNRKTNLTIYTSETITETFKILTYMVYGYKLALIVVII